MLRIVARHQKLINKTTNANNIIIPFNRIINLFKSQFTKDNTLRGILRKIFRGTNSTFTKQARRPGRYPSPNSRSSRILDTGEDITRLAQLGYDHDIDFIGTKIADVKEIFQANEREYNI